MIYVDALNWLGSFWGIDRGMRQPWKELHFLKRSTAAFAEAAAASGHSLTVVIDADQKSNQAAKKWRLRRQRELKTATMRVPLSIDVLLCEAFAQSGVRVLRPVGADADDVIAALAAAHGTDGTDGAVVVSSDGDFHRYDSPLRVCSRWRVRQNRLFLEPSAASPDSATALRPPGRNRPRPIEPGLAELALAPDSPWGIQSNVIADQYRASAKQGRVIKGVSSSSDRALGNLHVIARPLRAAVYSLLREERALEVVPEWDLAAGRVDWTPLEVKADPDPMLRGVLKDLGATAAWLEEREGPVLDGVLGGVSARAAAERKFNRCALAAELVAAASGGSQTMFSGLAAFPEFTASKKMAKRAAYLSGEAGQQ